MITIQSIACASLALGLMPTMALAANDVPSDVQIQLVDANSFPVEGVDIFVSDASGRTIIAEAGAASTLSAFALGDTVTISLPTLGTTFDVALTDGPATAITLEVGGDKRAASVSSVKTLNSFGYTGVGGVLVNDDCANALPISDGDTSFTTIGATTDGTVGSNNNDIWYLYTASCSGVATFSTCNQADFDTDLILMVDDNCGAQVALAINDDVGGCLGNTSILSAPVTAGTTYLLSVGGFGAGDAGSGTLTVSCAPATANDLCENAEPLAVNSSVTFNNSANSNSASDPIFSCIFSGVGFGSTWFSVVPESTSIFLDTSASTGSTDTVVAVYSGDCGSLVEVACNDDIDLGAGLFLSNLLAEGLTPGDEYLIRVSTFAEASAGDITLEVTDAGSGFQVCNGSGINTATLSGDTLPAIGQDFTVVASPAGAGLLAISLAGDQLLVPTGELLVDRNFVALLPSDDGSYTLSVPDDAVFVGFTVYLQALAGDGTLTNALKGDVGE